MSLSNRMSTHRLRKRLWSTSSICECEKSKNISKQNLAHKLTFGGCSIIHFRHLQLYQQQHLGMPVRLLLFLQRRVAAADAGRSICSAIALKDKSALLPASQCRGERTMRLKMFIKGSFCDLSTLQTSYSATHNTAVGPVL
jgi:hypothetical protein